MPITDTLDTAKAYAKAGFPEEQAQAMARTQELHAALTFEEVGKRVESQFTAVRAAQRADFAELEGKFEKSARDQFRSLTMVVFSAIAVLLGAAAFGLNILINALKAVP